MWTKAGDCQKNRKHPITDITHLPLGAVMLADDVNQENDSLMSEY